jgi:hypothetical protein
VRKMHLLTQLSRAVRSEHAQAPNPSAEKKRRREMIPRLTLMTSAPRESPSSSPQPKVTWSLTPHRPPPSLSGSATPLGATTE